MKKLLTFLVVVMVVSLVIPSALARENREGMESPSVSPDSEDNPSLIMSHEQEHKASVSVPANLKTSVQKLTDEDSNISEVNVSQEQNQIEVKYKLRAKLFGFIPVPYELQAKVDTKNQNISAKGPWWLLFAKDNTQEVQQALESDTSLLKATNQGTVLSKIISILKSLAGK